MDKTLSERLNILRFPLIVGVIFIHEYDTDVGVSNAAIGLDKVGVSGQL